MKEFSSSEEIRACIAAAISRGGLLRTGDEAKRIAEKCGGSEDSIYRELVEAGVRARINMELGSNGSAHQTKSGV